MHSFHHNNGIIDDYSDRQYQGKERKQINGKPKELHKEKSAHNSYRNCDGRNKRRSEVLQKNKYNQEDKDKCFQQRFLYLFNRGIEKIFCTENSKCMNAFWKLSLSILHYVLN